jgi:probable non-F420 flavinoid oxidoreductase
MPLISYHASHEQFTPGDLLNWAILAEQHGFDAVNCSDHFHPWSVRQGQSGFSFAWLGAAMQATKIPFGVVCAPGQRYHPAIVAQAAATLESMFPKRFWMSLGSGEALNENITGDKWPTKEFRNERLLECVQIMKRLFNGETVTHHGKIIIEEAKLYTRPATPPLMIGAAVTEKTAEWMGSWADGMITVHKPIEELKKTLQAFEKGGGKGKPVYVKVQLSYAKDKDAAIEGAWDQWRSNILSGEILDDLWKPEQYDAASMFVRKEDLEKMVHISVDPQFYIDLISSYANLGIQNIILHNVNTEQELFIRDFGENVLPHFKKK